MRTPVIRDLFLKFMGLTFISGLIAGAVESALSISGFVVMGGDADARMIAVVGFLMGLPLAVYGALIWLFLFRTDAVARTFWPKDRTIGVAPLAGDGELTVGVVVLLVGLYLLIPGLAELLAATGIVLESQDLASSAFTMDRNWTTFLPALSKVIVGAACIRWPHQIESFIVRGWHPKPALDLALSDDAVADPDKTATS
ncbi:MAG: hypothetical protein IT332_10975 [Ardenticatenales bacterium]|nr:hypothetical protein [Ardenticatenales bacterium]